jgi:NADPH:quinone reductase-like Zn-dependent oxidoreductase
MRAFGAHHAINYRTHEKWGVVVRDLTGGRGVDHVVDVGGRGTLEKSIEATRPSRRRHNEDRDR